MRRSRKPSAGPPLGVVLGCVVLSLALHAMALSQTWVQPHASPSAQSNRPIALRLAPRTASQAEVFEGSPGHLVASSADEVHPQSAQLFVEASALLEPETLPVLTLSSVPAVGEWDAYIPRPLLSKAPQPREAVFLEWPDFSGEDSHYEAVAALYIDESGLVQAVRLESGQLPEPLLMTVKQTFEGRRFHPGELQGQAVKSRVYIELSFDQPERISATQRGLQQ